RCAPGEQRRARCQGSEFGGEKWPVQSRGEWRSSQRRSLPVGRGRPLLAPEMRQGVRRLVVRAPDSQMRRDPLAQHPIHLGDATLTVQFDEAVSFREIFKLALDQGLVTNERLKEIV